MSLFPQKVKLVPFVSSGVRLPLGLPIEIDATVSEQHEVSCMVTEHPVTEGIALTDNVRPEADRLVLTAFFSGIGTNLIDSGIKLAGKSVSSQYEWLARLAKEYTALFRVETTLKTYDNMVIKRLGTPRNSSRADCIEATIEFQEIRKAQDAAKISFGGALSKSAAKPVRPVNTAAVKAGSQLKTPVEAPVEAGRWYNGTKAAADALAPAKVR